MSDRATRRTRLPSASLNKAFDNIDRSRKDAIKIFCVECVGGAPGYRGVIRDCTDIGCPLYPWRPYKGAKGESEESEVEDVEPEVEEAVDTEPAIKPEAVSSPDALPEPEPEPETKRPLAPKKKTCCENPDVLKLKEGRRECKNCGKKWKRKLKKKEQ